MVNTQGEHTSTSLTTSSSGTTSRTSTTVATFGVCGVCGVCGVVVCQCAQLLVDHGHVLVARDVTRAKTKARCTTGWTITKRVKRVKQKQQVQVKYRQKLK